jgi:hypothetical protein
MTTDLVRQLRRYQRGDSTVLTERTVSGICAEAAAEIERLQAVLTGIASCATCAACRGAARSALDVEGFDANGSPVVDVPAECCWSAGCKQPQMKGSLLCPEHYDKLPAPMRGEGTRGDKHD